MYVRNVYRYAFFDDPQNKYNDKRTNNIGIGQRVTEMQKL